MTEPTLLTTREVAGRLDVSVRTIVRWAESGRLPYEHRLPGTTGALLFTRAAVEAFLAPEPTEAS